MTPRKLNVELTEPAQLCLLCERECGGWVCEACRAELERERAERKGTT